jgi:hypothetical protein
MLVEPDTERDTGRDGGPRPDVVLSRRRTALRSPLRASPRSPFSRPGPRHARRYLRCRGPACSGSHPYKEPGSGRGIRISRGRRPAFRGRFAGGPRERPRPHPPACSTCSHLSCPPLRRSRLPPLQMGAKRRTLTGFRREPASFPREAGSGRFAGGWREFRGRFVGAGRPNSRDPTQAGQRTNKGGLAVSWQEGFRFGGRNGSFRGKL